MASIGIGLTGFQTVLAAGGCPQVLATDEMATDADSSVGPRLDGLAAAQPVPAGDKSTLQTSLEQKLAIGHQEVDRIVDEIEQIYGSQPTEWLTLEPIGNMLLHEMYEDFDELEDAVGGDFREALPQFETRLNPESGKAEFKVLAPDPDAPPILMTLRVTTRTDLWRVLHKSPAAAVRIPHLEFEIGADSKRRIDSVYNHISSAVWNLGAHLRAQVGAAEETTEQSASILATVDALEALLDVEEPFEIVVDDPTGASSFKPSDGVEVEEL